MRTQFYRCTLDSDACPASGNVVVLDSPSESEVECPVCARPSVRLRTREDPDNYQTLGRFPKHKRWDRQQRRKLTKIEVKADVQRRAALKKLEALKRGRGTATAAIGALKRAIDRYVALDLGAEGLADRDAKLQTLYAALSEATREQAPKTPGRQLREIEHASGLDLDAVEPQDFVEHLSAALSARKLAEIKRKRPQNQVRAGVLATIAKARARIWSDLESKPIVGQQGALEFLREFPGLEDLRLPSEAYDVPF